jgi:DNA gyrase subunit A
MERHWPAKDVAPLVELIDDPKHRLNDDGTYNLSEEQARAILDLRLQRLTALGRDEISEELHRLGDEIKDYLDILSSRVRVREIIKQELIAVRDEYSTPRRTEIVEGGFEMEDEDLIAREDMVVTVSHSGYIKRVALDTYRAQRRGGKGRSGMSTRDEDFVTRLFVANTHTPILFFSSRGIVYKLKVWRLPIGTPQARGKFLRNILPLEADERITSIMPLPEDEESWAGLDVVFATRKGTVRRNKLSDFIQVNRNGKIAMKFDTEEDGIIGVETCSEDNDVLLTTANGQCIRFAVTDVRVFAGRNSIGVRGISLAPGDRLISMCILNHSDARPDERNAYLKYSRAMRGEEDEQAEDSAPESDTAEATESPAGEFSLSEERIAQLRELEEFILTISENGYGKRSSSHEYRVSGRGGKGILEMVLNNRNGPLIASITVV